MKTRWEIYFYTRKIVSKCDKSKNMTVVQNNFRTVYNSCNIIKNKKQNFMIRRVSEIYLL